MDERFKQTLQQKDLSKANKHLKNAHHCNSLGKYKLKSQ